MFAKKIIVWGGSAAFGVVSIVAMAVYGMARVFVPILQSRGVIPGAPPVVVTAPVEAIDAVRTVDLFWLVVLGFVDLFWLVVLGFVDLFWLGLFGFVDLFWLGLFGFVDLFYWQAQSGFLLMEKWWIGVMTKIML